MESSQPSYLGNINFLYHKGFQNCQVTTLFGKSCDQDRVRPNVVAPNNIKQCLQNAFLEACLNYTTYIFFPAGESSQTHNFHLLRHLTYFVKLFGPLWVYSCFGFEALNGFLTTMIHGTQHISNQVTKI